MGKVCEWGGSSCTGMPANARSTQRFCSACQHEGMNAWQSHARYGKPFNPPRLNVAGRSQPPMETNPPPSRVPARPRSPLPDFIGDTNPVTQSYPQPADVNDVASACARLALDLGCSVMMLRDGATCTLRLNPQLSTVQSSSNGQRIIGGGTDGEPSYDARAPRDFTAGV